MRAPAAKWQPVQRSRTLDAYSLTVRAVYRRSRPVRETEPVTQTMNVTAARAHWSELVAAVSRRRKRVVLEEAGDPVAVLISTEDFERLKRYDAEREADFAVIARMRAAFQDVPADEIEREVARALAEVRAERRAEQAQRSA